MATLDRAILEITADADNDGNKEDGRFHLVGNASVTQQVNSDYVFGGGSKAASAVNAALGRIQTIPGGAPRQQFFFDVGAGSNIFEMQFMGWKGATDSDGNSLQWGNTGNGGTETDATGEGPTVQLQVFQRYLQYATTDSFAPAVLHWGEYTDGTYKDGTAIAACNGNAGRFGNPKQVAMIGPRNTHAAQDYSTFDGTFTAIEVIDLTNAIDGQEQVTY